MLMKHTVIKYALAAGCALLLAGAVFCPPLAMRSVSADDPQYVAKVGEEECETFDEALKAWTDENTTLTLLEDVEVAETIEIKVGETKTLDLGTYTLTLNSEEGGTVLKVEGTLTVKGGTLTGGNASQGGGIYVGVLGDLTLNGCTVSGNTAPQGGGVFVTGTLTLSGDTAVEDNTDGDGNASNIFLSPHNKIRLDHFTGRAGVTVTEVSAGDPFAEEDEESTGVFTSDDKSYVAEGGKLKTAPLSSIQAEYRGEGQIFPTTPLEMLKEDVSVSGINVNRAAYTGQLSFTLSGTLRVGPSEVTVTASGEGEETASDTVTVPVEKPVLVSIEAVAPEYPPKIYFDSPYSALTSGEGYTFKGVYNDGNSRTVCATAEETAQKCGEEYITDFYTLSADFTTRENGKAAVTVTAGSVSATFLVEVSKYVVPLSEEEVSEQSVIEDGTLDTRAFVPSLPAGVEIVAELNGAPLDVSALEPDVYEVKLSFLVTDSENYEEIASVFNTRLTVLRRELTYGEDGADFSATRSGGLPPAWRLKAEDVTRAVTVKLEGSLEAQAVYEITLQEKGVVVEDPGTLTVSLSVPEELGDKQITLFLMNADGTLSEVKAEREENRLVFKADSLSHARYVIAVETASRVYLILSIVFGVACVLGAAALLFYLVVKRKMRLR